MIALSKGLLRTIDLVKSLPVPQERQTVLNNLIKLLIDNQQNDLPSHLNFICTHNSRRSQLAQIWAQTFVHYYELNNITCYSGGTEATTVYPRIITTLKNQGFEIQQLDLADNPKYKIRFLDPFPPLFAFSKTFDDESIPKDGMIAVMNCAEADENCPFVPGALSRVPVRYDDPKVADGTFEEAAKYLERSEQIAAEMNFVFEQVNQKLKK